MSACSSSSTFVTDKLSQVRAFYERHFDARAIFDCGWYVTLRLGPAAGGAEVSFMEPRAGAPEFSGGATLNLRVDDVDELHRRLTESGVEPTTPLDDHPWGDRGFGIMDPCGLVVYCYEDIEPAPEYRGALVDAGPA